MPEFKIDEIVGIAEYIKSLDIYDQFDEIIVDQITQDTVMGRRPIEVEVKIVALCNIFYTHTEQRLFTEPNVSFDHFFEQEVKDLSASVLFGRKLVECIDEFDKFSIVDSDHANLVIAKNKTVKYVLRVYLNDDEIAVANVSAKFKFEHDTFNSSHEFKTKSSVKIDQLKEVLDSFEKLKKSIVLD